MTLIPAPATDELLAFALDLADEADAIALRYFRGEVGTEAKRDGSLVTRADREVEAHLVRRIGERYPDHAVLGEEQGVGGAAQASARWIVDPIDGTHGFLRGMPVWATLLAVERAGVLELGVASAPALGARWWAGRGLGAYRGALPSRSHAGHRLRVSELSSLGAPSAQVLYGSYVHDREHFGAGFDALLRAAWRTRNVGDFWGACLVAEGSAEAAVEAVPNAWDKAFMVPLLEEAGGRFSALSGAVDVGAPEYVVSNGLVHAQVLGLLGRTGAD